MSGWAKLDTRIRVPLGTLEGVARSTDCGALFSLLSRASGFTCNPKMRWSCEDALDLLQDFVDTAPGHRRLPAVLNETVTSGAAPSSRRGLRERQVNVQATAVLKKAPKKQGRKRTAPTAGKAPSDQPIAKRLRRSRKQTPIWALVGNEYMTIR